MRARSLVVALVLAALVSMLGFGVAHSSEGHLIRGGRVLIAQEPETEGQDTEDTSEETGADQGETGAAAEETGPPWTYQMARVSILLILVLGLGIAFWYWRLIARRQRSGT
jgi:hypothetical protein